MNAVWALAKKDLRLLLRDRRAALLLLALPLLFILVLGLLLGESFGQKGDDRVRVSIVDLDRGTGLNPGEPWSKVVQRDLADTAGLRLEIIDTREEAERLIAEHKRSAVLIFEPTFSDRVTQCSFLADGVNPFHRDGVYLDRVGATLLTDSKQPAGAAVVEQVAQVTLLRVILPWMIGKAFERLSEERFIDLLCNQVHLPVPVQFRLLVKTDKEGKAPLQELLRVAASGKPAVMSDYKQRVGAGVQAALKEQFKKYDLTGKTWAALTKAQEEAEEGRGAVATYQNRDGNGLLRRGAQRYQLLVPAYTVMFAFFLVMTVGWVFVAERRQGTLKRLRTAPIGKGEILLGKLLPCFLISVGQGAFLLLAGRLVFGMRWGPDDWPLAKQVAWLAPVVFSTSLAAIGLALLVAALARSEIQVAIYGAVPALVMALIGGCVLPREMMPEQTQQFSLLTPHGWALDAYRELLDPDPTARPNLAIVTRASAVLSAFGLGFLGLAARVLRLD
jgi:ABC-2 type transport system permease protein